MHHTTSIQRLDELLGGGFKAGSTVYVVGATGVGKTTFLVQAALSQMGYPGIFYDVALLEDQQPIAAFAQQNFGLELDTWEKGGFRQVNDYYFPRKVEPGIGLLTLANSDDAEQSAAAQKMINPPQPREPDRNAMRRCIISRDLRRPGGLYAGGESVEFRSQEERVEKFVAYHAHMGSRIVCIDGIDPEGMPRRERQLREAKYLAAQVLTGVGYSRVAETLPYPREEVAVVIGETSQHTQMTDLFAEFNADGHLAHADTVLLMGYDAKGQTVLKIAKDRWGNSRPTKNYSVVLKGNRLSIKRWGFL